MNQLKSIRVCRPEEDDLYHPHECERMVKVLEDRGYHATSDQVREIWSTHSDNMAASWLILPDDDDQLFSEMEGHFEEDGDIIVRGPDITYE